jgi:hypothetical protein
MDTYLHICMYRSNDKTMAYDTQDGGRKKRIPLFICI